MKGKLIVIDGTDGSGKQTQVERLVERLIKEGKRVETLDFPQYYTNFFGGLVGECLAGKHGDFLAVDPKIASVLYAADRWESSDKIRNWLDEGKIVILDRYVSSNQIHQGAKITDEEERRGFLSWLDKMEHEIFQTPRPDLILYMDLPTAISQRLVLQKSNQNMKKYLEGSGGDLHENNVEFLEKSKQSGLKLIAERNNWVKIDCTGGTNDILPIEEIHEKLYATVSKFLAG